MTAAPTLSFVVPCYNEEDALPETAHRLGEVLRDLVTRGVIAAGSNVWFVDDGSRDGTWALIESLARQSKAFVGVKLSRNCGHQRALLAGLLAADGDVLISIDADLQDDLAVVEQMVMAARAGSEIVYGVRNSRRLDSAFKRWTAGRYYALLRLLGVEVVPDHADFRLLGRRAVSALGSYPESNLFLRGLIPQLGFPSSRVYYERGRRMAGSSKYPLVKMAALATEGVTSFSAVPMRIIAVLGAVVFLAALLGAVWILGVRFFTDHAVPGWASITLPIYALGGVQLLCLGVVGEYVGRIYMESKRRPRFHVESTTGDAPVRPEIARPRASDSQQRQ